MHNNSLHGICLSQHLLINYSQYNETLSTIVLANRIILVSISFARHPCRKWSREWNLDELTLGTYKVWFVLSIQLVLEYAS